MLRLSAGFFFLKLMRYITIDIAHAFLLIIPFHGIFISLFFINNSGYSRTPNFYLGLLLFVYSSLALFQIIYPGHSHITLIVYYNYFLCELLISPFIFLYNSIMIQPDVRAVKRAHLLIISLIFLLFFLIGSLSGSVFIIMSVIYIMLNVLYLAGSVRLLLELIREPYTGWKQLRTSEYSLMIIINLLIAGIIILSTLLNSIIPVNTYYLAQIPKALVIYYIYYIILKKADFVN